MKPFKYYGVLGRQKEELMNSAPGLDELDCRSACTRDSPRELVIVRKRAR